MLASGILRRRHYVFLCLFFCTFLMSASMHKVILIYFSAFIFVRVAKSFDVQCLNLFIRFVCGSILWCMFAWPAGWLSILSIIHLNIGNCFQTFILSHFSLPVTALSTMTSHEMPFSVSWTLDNGCKVSLNQNMFLFFFSFFFPFSVLVICILMMPRGQ